MATAFLQPLVGVDCTGLLARLARRRRSILVRRLLDSLARPLRILDVGGTPHWWRAMGFDQTPGVEITLLNTEPLEPEYGFVVTRGDARSMPEIADGQFDVVFSNSVLEHVGDGLDRRRMAREIARVGRRFIVQTPNRWFPIEPHFLLPFFQFYPGALQAALVGRFDVGQFRQRTDPREARALIRSVELVDRAELQSLFPAARIVPERVLGMTKSLTAVSGF